jgi:hypothetical protein
MASTRKLKSALKKVVDRITHEIPTGPHTDVRRRKINPSFLDKSIESGRVKEIKRKNTFKNIVKDMIGLKGGGKATHGLGKAFMKGGKVK